MDKINLVNRLLKSVDAVLPVNQFTDEIKDSLRESINSVLHEMDVVTRDEFEAQQRVLLKTRQKIDELESKLKKYNLESSRN